jgi:hypothetical protein
MAAALKYNPDPEVNPINQLYLDEKIKIERRIAELQRKKDDGVQMEYVELLEYNELTGVYKDNLKWTQSFIKTQKKNEKLEEDIKNKNNEAVIESIKKNNNSISDILCKSEKYNNIDVIKYIHENNNYDFKSYFTTIDYNYIELIDKPDIIHFLSEKYPEIVFAKLDFYFTETCKHPTPYLIKFLVAFPQRYSYLLDVDCQSVKSYNINGVIY